MQMPSVGTFSVSLSISITTSVKSFELFGFGFGLLLQFYFPHPVFELYKDNHACSAIDSTVLLSLTRVK